MKKRSSLSMPPRAEMPRSGEVVLIGQRRGVVRRVRESRRGWVALVELPRPHWAPEEKRWLPAGTLRIEVL